jgi:hypothetical protein
MRQTALRLILLIMCVTLFRDGHAIAPLDAVVRWEEADLAFAMPPDWEVTIAPFETATTLVARGENALFAALALPDTAPYTQESHALFEAFYTGFQPDGLGGYRIEPIEIFGDLGAQVYPSGSYQGQPVTGAYGRLPDHRILYLLGTAREFMPVLASISLSAQADPAPPALSVTSAFSTDALPPPIVESTDGSINPPVAHDVAFTMGQPAASITPWGVMRLDNTLANPAIAPLPRVGMHDIAALPDGRLVVGDAGCRCLFVLSQDGSAGDSFGTFAANAPFSLNTRANGDIVAVDGSPDSGYQAVVYALQDDGSYKREAFPLNFNSANAPFVVPLGEGLFAVETLQSLLDGEIHTALSQVLPDEPPRFIGWLPFSVGELADIAPATEEAFIVGLRDGRAYRVGLDLSVAQIVSIPDGIRALAWDEAGLRLLAATSLNTLALAEISGRLARIGGMDIAHDEVVVGTLSAASPIQSWALNGTAGDIVTLSAVDLQRRDTLDPALTLIAPSGAVVAENDDQQGLDLWGVLDAQIRDVVLPEDGTYVVQISRIGGDGQFALGVTPARRFALEPQAAVTLTGALNDAIPVQRWIFQGQANQTITFTMTAQSGDLDPALELLLEDGRTLAYNDDGADPELGLNAQLFRITLPRDGTYILEASRFDYLGAGDYEIVAFTG